MSVITFVSDNLNQKKEYLNCRFRLKFLYFNDEIDVKFSNKSNLIGYQPTILNI